MEWQEGYCIGVKTIDDQHKKLVECANILQKAVKLGKGRPATGKALIELVEYTQYHFKAEETIMENCNYPNLEDQRKMHISFVNKLKDFLIRIKTNHALDPIELVRFLNYWLVNHISSEDKKIGNFILKKELQQLIAQEKKDQTKTPSKPID